EAVDQETQLAESEEFDSRRKLLAKAITKLNDRERRIFEARRLSDDPLTLEQLSEEFGVSRERIRQIEVRAFEKVQKAVTRAAAEFEAGAA
ncbi:MAG: sigma-70 family RNA polymerase sigma factor, partial [Hoeflea sp.]|nr:sigma-70 family RNA polymerase sigma factor [Hoeflea sp.]